MKIRSRFGSLLALAFTLPFAHAASSDVPSSATAGDATAANAAVGATSKSALPVLQVLTPTSDAIAAGSSAKLRWSALGAAHVTVTADHGSSPGRVSGNSLIVRPAVTTTYTIVAANAAGESARTITVPVTEAAPALPVGVFSGPGASGLTRHHR